MDTAGCNLNLRLVRAAQQAKLSPGDLSVYLTLATEASQSETGRARMTARQIVEAIDGAEATPGRIASTRRTLLKLQARRLVKMTSEGAGRSYVPEYQVMAVEEPDLFSSIPETPTSDTKKSVAPGATLSGLKRSASAQPPVAPGATLPDEKRSAGDRNEGERAAAGATLSPEKRSASAHLSAPAPSPAPSLTLSPPNPNPSPENTSPAAQGAARDGGKRRTRQQGRPACHGDGAVFVKILAVDGSEVPVTEDYLARMQECYPAVDVKAELRKMAGWAFNNKPKRKTPGGMSRFIDRWLAQEQDRGGRAPGYASRVAGAARPSPQGNGSAFSQASAALWAQLTPEDVQRYVDLYAEACPQQGSVIAALRHDARRQWFIEWIRQQRVREGQTQRKPEAILR